MVTLQHYRTFLKTFQTDTVCTYKIWSSTARGQGTPNTLVADWLRSKHPRRTSWLRQVNELRIADDACSHSSQLVWSGWWWHHHWWYRHATPCADHDVKRRAIQRCSNSTNEFTHSLMLFVNKWGHSMMWRHSTAPEVNSSATVAQCVTYSDGILLQRAWRRRRLTLTHRR